VQYRLAGGSGQLIRHSAASKYFEAATEAAGALDRQLIGGGCAQPSHPADEVPIEAPYCCHD
jgi:hypothetical protein